MCNSGTLCGTRINLLPINGGVVCAPVPRPKPPEVVTRLPCNGMLLVTAGSLLPTKLFPPPGPAAWLAKITVCQLIDERAIDPNKADWIAK